MSECPLGPTARTLRAALRSLISLACVSECLGEHLGLFFGVFGVHVNHRRLDLGVAHRTLDIHQVNATGREQRSKAVPQIMES